MAGAISNDLERTLTLSHHFLTLNISQTATDTVSLKIFIWLEVNY